MSSKVLERPADSGAAPAKVPVPTQIAHFVIYSSRFQEMVSFYKAFLALESSHEDENMAFMTYDEEHHRIAVVNIPGLADRAPDTTGFHHVAFTFATLRDLFETYERLQKLGIKPYWTVNHGPTTSMYFHDPDRNRIEFQVDNFPTAAEGIAYCRLPEYAENPVGTDVDPIDMLRRLRAGESEAELKKRVNIGPRGLGDFPRG